MKQQSSVNSIGMVSESEYTEQLIQRIVNGYNALVAWQDFAKLSTSRRDLMYIIWNADDLYKHNAWELLKKKGVKKEALEWIIRYGKYFPTFVVKDASSLLALTKEGS